jgi:hypothetical protein
LELDNIKSHFPAQSLDVYIKSHADGTYLLSPNLGMLHNILITGASGYLGGTLLARWKSAQLPPYGTLYALVRGEEQAQAVKSYGATPLILDLKDSGQVIQQIIDREISIIFFLIDAYGDGHQKTMIQALKHVKQKTGREVHFLHTTGAKQFSRHAGVSTDKPLLDNDPELYDILKRTVSPHEWFAQVWIRFIHVAF